MSENPPVAPWPGPASVRPAYGGGSLADVLPSVLAALGVPGSTDPLGLAAGPLAGVRAVAVLLIDGLGQHQLPVAAPCAPTLAALAGQSIGGAYATAITAGFPTTTPTSLATLGTGAPPGGHGILGFFLNVPGTDRVLNHVQWGEDPDPMRWQPLDTQFERAARAGVSVRVVSRPEFDGSGLTRAVLRGGRYIGAADQDALAESMLAGLRPAPALVYGYDPNVDKAGHLFGVGSPEWNEAVVSVDQLLVRLIDGLPPGGALVLTADHGQLDIPTEHRLDLDLDPQLRHGVRLVAGEARVRYLHTLPGARDDVLATWRGVLGGAAWVVSREQAVAEGWFGPVPAEHLARVGDVVVACQEDFVVLAGTTEPAHVARMVAFHGSATETEMRIPLLVVRRD